MRVPQTAEEEAQSIRVSTLRAALKATDLSQVKFAKLLEMDVRTLTRQLHGDSAIDGPAGAIYHMLAYETATTLDALRAEWMIEAE